MIGASDSGTGRIARDTPGTRGRTGGMTMGAAGSGPILEDVIESARRLGVELDEAEAA